MEPGRVHLLGPYEIPGFSGKRHVRAYVPVKARAELRPLLFMFDGQNVFDDAPSFAGGWHAHAAVERLAKTVAPPVVLAIDHGHGERIRELSPFEMTRGPHAGPGRASELLRWITEWLLPHTRRRLDIDADPRRSVVGGSSLGGLAALYAHLEHPEVFGGCLAMSPSIWVAERALVEHARHRTLAPWSRIYLDAGRREQRGILERDTGLLAELLRTKHGERVLFRVDAKGTHREADWRRRLPVALRFFFGTSRAPSLRQGPQGKRA